MTNSENTEYWGYTPQDLERWLWVSTKRFNLKAEIKNNGFRPVLVVEIPSSTKPGKSYKHIADKMDAWEHIINTIFYMIPPNTQMYDQFQPRFAKFKELEIHPWIKRYKELD